MSARISMAAHGSIPHRQRPRERGACAVAPEPRERSRDFAGVAAGVALGAVLWLIVGSIAGGLG